MQAEEVAKVLDKLTANGKEVLTWYAHWYIIASLAYMAFGGVIIYLSVIFAEKIDPKKDWGFFTIKYIGILLGLLIVFAQIPDLFSSYGIGAHQLIKDIRGSG